MGTGVARGDVGVRVGAGAGLADGDAEAAGRAVGSGGAASRLATGIRSAQATRHPAIARSTIRAPVTLPRIACPGSLTVAATPDSAAPWAP